MPAALPIALADDGLAELAEADVAVAVLVEQPHERVDVRRRQPDAELAPGAWCYRLYLGIADGVSVARAWACRCSKGPPRRGGPF